MEAILVRTHRYCRVRGGLGATGLWFVLMGLVFASERSYRIQFARGHNSAVVKGSVVRGERDGYRLRAKVGQTMSVRLTSLESNAVFSIYPPGRRRPLPGTQDGADATRWTGKLPKSGEYLIQIGATRGNATYVLRVVVQGATRHRRAP
jgi:hypothetical protein